MIRYPALPYLSTASASNAANSASTLSLDSPPRTPPGTPTTPMYHHYPGRPLPQPPRQVSSPLTRPTDIAAAQAQALSLPGAYAASMFEYPHFTDLDVLAARVIEGDHDGQNYEVSHPLSTTAY